MLKVYQNEVENQLNKNVEVLRSDCGGECGSPFEEKYGIRPGLIAPYSSKLNDITERKNHTLKEMMNVMILSYGLSQSMWG